MPKEYMSWPVAPGAQSPGQAAVRSHPLGEKPISGAYPVIDNDLARDNLENDIPEADLQDL